LTFWRKCGSTGWLAYKHYQPKWRTKRT
jgi:hypothetical protein